MLHAPSISSMSSSSSLSSRVCFNRDCSKLKLEHYRPGWRLRTGDFADLCDSCAFAYERGKFCDIFHLKASGWRCCESCSKRIHCGCIVSASAYMLLDAGGIECLACARKKVALGPNLSPPPAIFFQSPIAEKLKDLSIKRSSSTGSNQIGCQPPSFLGPSVLRFDLHNCVDSYEYSQPNSRDFTRATACSMDIKRGMNDLMGKLMSENSKNHTSYILNKQKAGPNCKVRPMISYKEGPCGTRLNFPLPITTPIETNCLSRLDGSNLCLTPASSPLDDLNGGADSPFESKSQILRTHLDKPGKYQVIARYRPKVSCKDQVLQNLSKESESVVTPLFEKMLSASDTGKIGRLVLPKKCAEAFLPRISHADGVPLKVHDLMGREWTFQFRFWPNNNSRMYVLEGVTPCMQSMQLQAGDTIIFSRLDPERKLIMGFRKASVAQSSDQAEPVDTHTPSKVKKSAYVAKETPEVELSSEKKKGSMMITRSKRQKVEKSDLTELKLTCKEAQELLMPPPNFTPSIMEIEGFVFEEYEEAPIIGNPAECASFRSTCSANKTLLAEQDDEEDMEDETEGLSMSPKTTKHPRHRSGCSCIVCIQSPSGKGPKHDQCCSCTVCDTVKRRKRSLLLRREKKQIDEEDNNTHKEVKSLNSDEDQSGKNSGNTSLNHDHDASSPLKAQIDLNFQPDKDDKTLPGSDTTAKNKSLDHDDTEKSSFKPPSSSKNQTDMVDEEKLTKVAAETIILLQGVD